MFRISNAGRKENMNPIYVTSPGTSIKLKISGAPQNSEFYWFLSNLHPLQLCTMEAIQTTIRVEKLKEKNYQYFSAFLTDELGEMLPGFHLPVKSDNPGDKWLWTTSLERHFETTEPEARGKILLYLIENKLISFEAKSSESEGV